MSEFITDNSLAALGAPYALPCVPTPVSAPQWLAFNDTLAQQLGLPDEYRFTDKALQVFSGNLVPKWASPVAHAYAGHQFSHFVPQLGDGRALLLAEVITTTKQRFDVQLKGAGQTPFSRRGDGRSPLGPVLREYLVSEAMFALGVPTTRALAATLTGDWVQRETALPGAVLTRVASSHFRVGSFQYLSAQSDTSALNTFADYVIQRHYPACANAAQPYLQLLNCVIEKQAYLIAKWMSLGFIHGVMNTDNMSISGETIDYGPCAFMDEFNPSKVFSFIDKQGRYAWGNQPRIGSWNLARLAEALLPLLADTAELAVEKATEALQRFNHINEQHFLVLMTQKIGIDNGNVSHETLVRDLLNLMSSNQIDYSQCFRLLSQSVININTGAAVLFDHSDQWYEWAKRWQQQLLESGASLEQVSKNMDTVNPAIIPRNHQIELAIQQASLRGDLTLFNRLNTALATPYNVTTENADLAIPPTKSQQVENTFCGT